MNDRPIRLLLADDQQLLRAGFKMVLGAESDIDIVGEAGDGVEAFDLTRRLVPDVVLMDIRMPRRDGVAATADIVQANLPTRVLVLTTFDLDEYVVGALRAGAAGFLTKDAPAADLVEAIRTVHRGGAVVAPHILSTLLGRLAEHRGGDGDAKPAIVDSLTAREREVLLLLAKGLTNAEIADALTVGETTVKTHVGHLLTKLGVRDRVQAVVLAYESGLVKPGQTGLSGESHAESHTRVPPHPPYDVDEDRSRSGCGRARCPISSNHDHTTYDAM